MHHETFEADFMGVVKGMPDLERIVSRIHAGTCKIKDFLKVLDVCAICTSQDEMLTDFT
jgi:DNA mismatch repair protein MSH6